MTKPSVHLQHPGTMATVFMAFIVLLGWFGLVAQFYITLSSYAAGRTLPGVLVEIISYFTIICNVMVSVSITVILLKPSSAWGRFFSCNTVLTAITLYILIVGIVYNAVLRGLIVLNGLAFSVNEIMHVIIPTLYTIFWLAVVPKAQLTWKKALPWLWIPFFYLVYILIRGAICGLYPYPFMNAGKFGYGHVAISSLIVMFAFLVVSQLLIFVSGILGRDR